MECAHRTTQESRNFWRNLRPFLTLGLILLPTPTLMAQTRTLHVNSAQIPIDDGFPKAIQFFCAPHYRQDYCKDDALALRLELKRYPVEYLGPWSFVLVPSGDWQGVIGDVIGNPRTPAVTMLDRRTTILEEALFRRSGVASRTGQLLRTYKVSADALLELAVSHELAHALCHEKNECQTDRYSRSLRKGQMACLFPQTSHNEAGSVPDRIQLRPDRP